MYRVESYDRRPALAATYQEWRAIVNAIRAAAELHDLDATNYLHGPLADLARQHAEEARALADQIAKEMGVSGRPGIREPGPITEAL